MNLAADKHFLAARVVAVEQAAPDRAGLDWLRRTIPMAVADQLVQHATGDFLERESDQRLGGQVQYEQRYCASMTDIAAVALLRMSSTTLPDALHTGS